MKQSNRWRYLPLVLGVKLFVSGDVTFGDNAHSCFPIDPIRKHSRLHADTRKRKQYTCAACLQFSSSVNDVPQCMWQFVQWSAGVA